MVGILDFRNSALKLLSLPISISIFNYHLTVYSVLSSVIILI